MTTNKPTRIQHRGFRIGADGRVTQRFVDMTTGRWGTKTIRANSAAAKAVIRRANGKAASA